MYHIQVGASNQLGQHAGVVNFVMSEYTDRMHIPHTLLSSEALRAIVEEFVTRDGTDHSSIELRIETVLLQLHTGRVVLHFDGEPPTCNIVPAEDNPTVKRRNK